MVCMILTVIVVLTVPLAAAIVYRINFTSHKETSVDTPFSLFWVICICLCSLIMLKYISEVFVFRIGVNQAAIRKQFGKIFKVDQKPGIYLKFLSEPKIVSTKLTTVRISLKHHDQGKPEPTVVEVVVNYKITNPVKSLDIYDQDSLRFVRKETIRAMNVNINKGRVGTDFFKNNVEGLLKQRLESFGLSIYSLSIN